MEFDELRQRQKKAKTEPNTTEYSFQKEHPSQELPKEQNPDDSYQLLGGSQDVEDSEDFSLMEESLQKLESYKYFDGNKIFNSLEIGRASCRERV